jgi:hypothetical protein
MFRSSNPIIKTYNTMPYAGILCNCNYYDGQLPLRPVDFFERKSRYFIKVGHAGFLQWENIKDGYVSEAEALSAIHKAQKN